MADVIAIWRVLNLLLFLFSGRCCNHLGWCYCLLYFFVLADVIANVFVVDLITTYITVADVIACCDVFIIGWFYAKVYVEDVMSTYCNMRRYGWCYCQYVCGRCYNHRGWCYCLLCLLFCYWLMLLPMCGRWYSHFCVMWWLMLLPSGRWNGHCRVGGIKLADVIANWQMLLPRVIIVLF